MKKINFETVSLAFLVLISTVAVWLATISATAFVVEENILDIRFVATALSSPWIILVSGEVFRRIAEKINK